MSLSLTTTNSATRFLCLVMAAASVLLASAFADAQAPQPLQLPGPEPKAEPDPAPDPAPAPAPAPEVKPLPRLKWLLDLQPPPQPPAQPPLTLEPAPPTEAEPVVESEPVVNTDAASGPPEAAVAPVDWSDVASDDDEASWYLDKEDDAYWDIAGAWGWDNDAYLATISILNMYLYEEGDLAGFHGRMLAVGALSFERRVLADDGSSALERETTFVLQLMDPILRLYFAEPVFLALGRASAWPSTTRWCR
jgi:hypothetical protein